MLLNFFKKLLNTEICLMRLEDAHILATKAVKR
jgi:hypothetical protein